MIKNNYSSALNRFAGGVLYMFFGGILMVVLVLTFHKKVEKKDMIVKKQTRIVKINRKHKTIAKKTKPKSVKKIKKVTAKAPPPDLGSIISGVPMNIPEYAPTVISNQPEDLLDNVTEDIVMTDGTVDFKPKIISRPPMQYPEAAARERITGYVIVSLLIGKDGSVEMAKIIESRPKAIFDAAVLSGVKDWRFSTAKYKGMSVKVWAKQKISFNL